MESNAMDPKDISDGFHTMNDLYEHRRALTAALTQVLSASSWRSKAHHPADDPIFEGYFIVGIYFGPTIGDITYHYKLSHWNDFEGVRTLDHAPKWDKHTPELTVERLFAFAQYTAKLRAEATKSIALDDSLWQE